MDNFLHYLVVAYYFATSDIKSRFRTATIGSAWLTLNIAIPAMFLSIIWVTILQQGAQDFVPHFIIGFAIWQTISGVLLSSSSLFTRASSIIKITPVPFYFFTQELILGKLIEAKGAAFVIVITLIIFPDSLIITPTNMALLVVGFILTILSVSATAHIIAFLGSRYSDIEQLNANIISIAFFCTPIIYLQERLLDYQFLLYFNPFYYFVESLRQPLISDHPDIIIYIVLFGITITTLTTSAIIDKKLSGKCTLWI